MIGKTEEQFSNDWNVPGGVYFCLFLMLVSGSRGAERFQPLLPENNGIVSANVRFYVTGPNRAENVEIAAWADEASARLDDVMEWEMPRQSGERLVQIEVVTDDSQVRDIALEQYLSDVGMIQELRLRNPGREDQAAAVEMLCRLLLDRYILQQLGFPELTEYDFVFPEWFLYGITSHFSAAMRMDNRLAVMAAWGKGEDLSLGRVLDEKLGDPVLRAARGELFEWIHDMPDRHGKFMAVVDGARVGTTMDAGWFLQEMLGMEPRAASQAWDLHVVSLQHVIAAPGVCMPEDVLALRDALLVRPEVLGAASGEDVIFTYRLGNLLEWRRTGWIDEVAMGIAVRINQAVVGKGEELGHVAALYLEFLERLPVREMEGFAGVYTTDTTDRDLRKLLEEADRALALLDRKMQTED